MIVSLLLDLLSFSINNPGSFNLFFISFVVSNTLVPSQLFSEPLLGLSPLFNYRAQTQYSRKRSSCLAKMESLTQDSLVLRFMLSARGHGRTMLSLKVTAYKHPRASLFAGGKGSWSWVGMAQILSGSHQPGCPAERGSLPMCTVRVVLLDRAWL